jgi:DNA repair protein RecO (recombination protein O)
MRTSDGPPRALHSALRILHAAFPMTLVSTPAIVLHAIRYGETSKIVRLLTRDHGVQSAMAKGAHRPRSKFGGRLQVLSEGMAQLYFKPQRELHTLSEFDVTDEHQALAGDLRRFTAATALAELVMRLSPGEPSPELYQLVHVGLDSLSGSPKEDVDEIALRVLWHVVGLLGFAPSMDACARDGRQLPEGKAAFSVADGGLVCRACAAGRQTSQLGLEDRRVLTVFVEQREEPVGPLSAKHLAAHRRLFTRFVERHVAEGTTLRALALWQES